MNSLRGRKSWIVFLAVLLLFAACKGESPTTPPPGSGVPPGGSPPPTGVNVVLTVTNANPLVDSTVTVTATVTNNGQPVPNGTAVEFSSSAGVLNGGGTSTIKTTTNGVATVTLTSGTTGLVRVTATVNNVTRQTDVNFVSSPVIPPPPNTAPTITSVTPSVGRPQGGELIHITGTNFNGKVRVLFNTGGATAVEGSVQSVTSTTIDVITPPVNLSVSQQLVADIIVLTNAGTAAEQRVEASDAFTYRSQVLTPVISTVTPNSGPVTGGTRVTIFGEGFQEPVQVLFNTAEAKVLNVFYDRINVETPVARDTNPDGSGTVTGPVTVLVRNINSQTETTMASAFLYKAAMQITAVGPTEGPVSGGTLVEIQGIGFVGPVAVVIGGVAAQPISVTGTKVVAKTSPVNLTGCADVTGEISVTNIVNGDTATATPSFIYRVVKPIISGISGSAVPGGSINVTVLNALGFPRLSLGGTNLLITASSVNPDGTTTYTATVPTTIALTTQACPAVSGASRQVATPFSVTYTSVTTGCTDTLANAATIAPPANTPILTLVPGAFGPFSATISPGDPVGPPIVPPSVAPSAPQTVTLTNTGSSALTVNSVTPSGPGCAAFDITSPPTPSTVQPCDPFPITVVYNGTVAPQTHQCTLTIATDVGSRALTLSGRSQ